MVYSRSFASDFCCALGSICGLFVEIHVIVEESVG